MKTTFILAAVAAAASSASAAIVPSWRGNPISAAAIANDPALRGAVSISLMVTLSGASQFNVAGLDFSPVLSGSGGTVYNNPFGGSTAPSTALLAVFPALEYDTYVTGPDRAGAISTPGKYSGAGTADFGPGGSFNVAWGATPNSGSPGIFEIARLTFLNLAPLGGPIPVNGEVRSSDAPNTPVPVPSIPAEIIPEPTTLGIAACMAGALFLRRSR